MSGDMPPRSRIFRAYCCRCRRCRVLLRYLIPAAVATANAAASSTGSPEMIKAVFPVGAGGFYGVWCSTHRALSPHRCCGCGRYSSQRRGLRRCGSRRCGLGHRGLHHRGLRCRGSRGCCSRLRFRRCLHFRCRCCSFFSRFGSFGRFCLCCHRRQCRRRGSLRLPYPSLRALALPSLRIQASVLGGREKKKTASIQKQSKKAKHVKRLYKHQNTVMTTR